MELPPPRFGDWSSANRHLTAGGTVEGIPWGNPYREYYLSLHKKNMEKKNDKLLGEWHMGHIALFGALLMREGIVGDEKESLKDLMYKALTKGKPHNNGEDTAFSGFGMPDDGENYSV